MTKPRIGTAWYSVRALYRADYGHKDASSARALLEELVVLFRSAPPFVAAKGYKVAKQHQHAYRNVYGEMVRWRLHQVLDIVELMDQTITEGSEVYSRFHRNANPDSTMRRLGYRTKQPIINV
jgi:hypothetical protein